MSNKTRKWIIIGVGLAITLIIVPSMNSLLLTSASTASKGATASGISCDSMEHFIMHIHAHLDIFINGNPYQIPSQIGIIPNQCIYLMT